MLREHGAQRPTIFEILSNIHRLRGTKSRFAYSIPEQAPLSPRSMNAGGTKAVLDNLVTYKPQSPVPIAKNNGTQARERVLEAIAPMRRGRPEASSESRSRSTSPRKEPTKTRVMGNGFGTALSIDKDQAWKLGPRDNAFIRGHKSGLVTSGAWKVKPSVSPDPNSKGKGTATHPPGFDNDFLTNGFGDSFGGLPLALDLSNEKPKAAPIPIPKPQPPGVLPTPQDSPRMGISRSYKAKDAFEGLGLAEKPPVPTLAEARTARTGLGLAPEQSFTPRRPSPGLPSPPPPRPLPGLPQPVSENAPAEERFPPIEDLDRAARPKPSYAIGSSQPPVSKGTSSVLKPPAEISTGFGSRSQTVTGTSMQDRKDGALGEIPGSQVTGRLQSSRPPLARGYTTSSTSSYSNPKEATDSLADLLSRSSPASSSRDWLTGEDQENVDILSRFNASAGIMPGVDGTPGEPVLRDSPSKRASFIEKSPHLIAQPLEGNVEQIVLPETVPRSVLNSSTSSAIHTTRPGTNRGPRLPEINGDVIAKGTGLSDNWSPLSPVMPKGQLPRKPSAGSVSSDDGPENPDGGFGTLKELRKSGRKKADVSSKPKRRQSSVHDLVDLWGGSSILEKDKDKRNKPEPETSRSSIFPSGLDTSTGVTGPPRSLSPTHAPFQSSTTDKTSTSPRFISSAVDPQRKPTSSAVASRMVNPTSRPSSSPNTQSQPRSRPQSMMIFPSSKSAGGETGLPSPSLAVPPDKEGIRTISRSRRTSITDMVQRYEGAGGPRTNSPSLVGMPALSPSVPPKHTGLGPRQSESQNIGSSHTRFIKVSPTNSPVIRQGLSLNVPEGEKSGFPGSRTSPTHRTSPSRRSPIELGRSSSSQSTHQLPPGDDGPEPKSPSPERPYAGVSKLIDQWQKKAEESNSPNARKPGGIGAKRPGVGVGGGR
jgi:AP2-associated kinase